MAQINNKYKTLMSFFLKKPIITICYYTWLIIIIVLTILPKAHVPELESEGMSFRLDYPAHLIFFFCFGLIHYLYFHYFRIINSWKVILPSLLLAIAIAIGDEYIQKLIPSRRFNPVDLFYNVLGTVIGFYLLTLIKTWKRIA